MKFEPSLELESLFNCHGAQNDVVLADIGSASGKFSRIVFLPIHQNLALNCESPCPVGNPGGEDGEEGGFACSRLSHHSEELSAIYFAVQRAQDTFIGFVVRQAQTFPA